MGYLIKKYHKFIHLINKMKCLISKDIGRQMFDGGDHVIIFQKDASLYNDDTEFMRANVGFPIDLDFYKQTMYKKHDVKKYDTRNGAIKKELLISNKMATDFKINLRVDPGVFAFKVYRDCKCVILQNTDEIDGVNLSKYNGYVIDGDITIHDPFKFLIRDINNINDWQYNIEHEDDSYLRQYLRLLDTKECDDIHDAPGTLRDYVTWSILHLESIMGKEDILDKVSATYYDALSAGVLLSAIPQLLSSTHNLKKITDDTVISGDLTVKNILNELYLSNNKLALRLANDCHSFKAWFENFQNGDTEIPKKYFEYYADKTSPIANYVADTYPLCLTLVSCSLIMGNHVYIDNQETTNVASLHFPGVSNRPKRYPSTNYVSIHSGDIKSFIENLMVNCYGRHKYHYNDTSSTPISNVPHNPTENSKYIKMLTDMKTAIKAIKRNIGKDDDLEELFGKHNKIIKDIQKITEELQILDTKKLITDTQAGHYIVQSITNTFNESESILVRDNFILT